MSILEKIKSVDDINKLNTAEFDILANEIRQFLINNVMVTGGHLASNLGVVELTLALHKVFNLPHDKIIYDVGHQAYVHKMLTGRLDGFKTLRQLGGLSGFPKIRESEYDSFGTGHASTSISAAVGMARARDILGEDYNVIAFIGDGAMTGGMTFEALNDVGLNKTKMIIVLNDNEMSIEKNVGGLSAYLSKLRVTAKYRKTKDAVQGALINKGKVGDALSKFLKSTKERIKFATIAAPYFEAIGITYIGIIDGHDINQLTEIFEAAKSMDGPVLIHTFTKKGLGYADAEKSPEKYHGVSCAFKDEEDNVNSTESFSKLSGKILANLAHENKNITAITAAMMSGCGLNVFAKEFPERFFDVGIAEPHAVTMAAGMAARGVVPFVYMYSTFLQRAYDQILHDVCIQNLHVVFMIDRAGLVGEDGETHQGLFDISFLNHIPNVTLLAPCDAGELEAMMEYALKADGPVFIRYPKHNAKICENSDFCISKAKIIKENSNASCTIVAEGTMADVAVCTSQILEQKYGISADVINLRTLKPFDRDVVINAIKKTKCIFTLEDNQIYGGMGSLILTELNDEIKKNNASFNILGFPDEFIQHGSRTAVFEFYKLDAENLANHIYERIQNK